MQVSGKSYQSLHCAMQSMSMVSSELGVGSLQRRVSGSLRLLDTVRPLACQRLRIKLKSQLTRCGAPWRTGCAARSSLILVYSVRGLG